jgi:UDP-N-acetylglucosamine:LPS N-acetylglucosamine transferase
MDQEVNIEGFTEISDRPFQQAGQSIKSVERVLILTSSLGAGHLRAGQAIEAELKSRNKHVEVYTLDFWALMDGKVAQTAMDSYLHLVEQHPNEYSEIFSLDADGIRSVLNGNFALHGILNGAFRRLSEIELTHLDIPESVSSNLDKMLFVLLRWFFPGRPRGNNPVSAFVRRIVIWAGQQRMGMRLEKQILGFKPQIIIATQTLAASLLPHVRWPDEQKPPVISVVVNWGFVQFYLQNVIDHYCIPHESMHLHIDPEASSVTGVPLMPEFADLPDKLKARNQLGLDDESWVVLVQGGGLALHVAKLASEILVRTTNVQLLVQVGRNVAARQELENLNQQFKTPLMMTDWTDNMGLYIRAADLVVGKPGGVTLAECVRCERPLLVYQSIGGQEDLNIRFMEQHGFGLQVAEEEMVTVMLDILADPDRLTRMQKNAKNVGQKDAAGNVVDVVYRLVKSLPEGR